MSYKWFTSLFLLFLVNLPIDVSNASSNSILISNNDEEITLTSPKPKPNSDSVMENCNGNVDHDMLKSCSDLSQKRKNSKSEDKTSPSPKLMDSSDSVMENCNGNIDHDMLKGCSDLSQKRKNSKSEDKTLPSPKLMDRSDSIMENCNGDIDHDASRGCYNLIQDFRERKKLKSQMPWGRRRYAIDPFLEEMTEKSERGFYRPAPVDQEEPLPINKFDRYGRINKKIDDGTNEVEVDQLYKTGRAARLRTESYGLSRSTANYTDRLFIKNPSLYGPYVSALLADEDFQQVIDDRNDAIIEERVEDAEERAILRTRFWLNRAKKVEIRDRKQAEKREYGHELVPGELVNPTLKEKMIDREAKRREMLGGVDMIAIQTPLERDQSLRAKLTLHPFIYKFRSPEYTPYMAERAPEDLISIADLRGNVFKDEQYAVGPTNLQRANYLEKYMGFSWENVFSYGPTLGDIINFVFIIGFLRFCYFSLKFNPKVGFIIAGTGVICAYAYKSMFFKVLLTGINALPAWPRFFRLAFDAADTDVVQALAKDIVSQEGKNDGGQYFDPYTFSPEDTFTPIILKLGDPVVSYLKNNVSEQVFEKISRIYLFTLGIPDKIVIFTESTMNLKDSLLNQVYLTQVLRSGRRYVPYPMLFHFGTCYVIQQFMLNNWVNYQKRIDLFIFERLVPEMRYSELVYAEYIRTYITVAGLYLILLAMLHALFNQYYYLPLISETFDVFMGKRGSYKVDYSFATDERYQGGDLSWQAEWDFLKPRKKSWKVWYGLLGKPRKYKIPKWLRIFNPFWWATRKKRRRD